LSTKHILEGQYVIFMSMILIKSFLFIASFFVIWYASGIIINVVDSLAHRLKMSSFVISFFVLGILTSIPEFSVGLNSIINGRPEIFVGNLLGASLIIFILVIPILAIFGNGIKLVHQLTEKNLIFSLLVVATPVFLIADNLLTRTEGVFLIFIYGILFYFIEKKGGLLKIFEEKTLPNKKNLAEIITRLIFAISVIFFTSNFIVNQTIYFSQYFGISSFIISLIFLSIGTNLPELSLAVRSVTMGKKDIALGDYLGSSAANTLFFGILTLLNGKRVVFGNYAIQTLILTLLGLGIFYLFSRSKNDISRKEGLILLLVYVVFISVELIFK